MTHLIAYATTLVVFLAIDFVWLSQIAAKLYRAENGHLFADKFNMLVAVGFYAVYVVGIVFFAVAPALAQGSLRIAAMNGAFLGFIAYATYDLTNLATLRDWSWRMSLIDMGWGTALTATAAVGGFLLTRMIAGR